MIFIIKIYFFFDPRTDDHSHYFELNKKMTATINTLVRNIDIKKANIDLMKLKILQHTKEFQARNLALKKEKENIQKNYQELKVKMMKFREEEVFTFLNKIKAKKNNI